MALIKKLQEIKENLPKKLQVTRLLQTFSDNAKIEELDLRYIDTSECIQISSLFSNCTNLKRVNMSNWNTDNIQQISAWFIRCSSLEEVDLSNFNTKRLTAFRSWFYGCSSLKEIVIDITNATDLIYTFKDCISLEKLDFSGTEDVKTSIDVSTTGLSREGLLNMLDTLPTLETSITITIGEEKMALLTEQDIALFTQKNFTLA